MKKQLTILVFMLLCLEMFPKTYRKESVIGMEIKFGPSFVVYNSKTNYYFKNHFYPTANFSMYVGPLFFESNVSFKTTYVKNDLVLWNSILLKNDKVQLAYRKLVLGCKFNIKKRDISIDPYFAWLSSNILNEKNEALINTQKGYSFGFYITRYFYTRHFGCFTASLNNSFNLSHFDKANPHFGNSFYTLDFCVGCRWSFD